MSTRFKRTKEDFVCANCGAKVKGNGYTNHCPRCLFSQHVDINPGDRASTCGGLMKPVDVELKDGEYTLVQRCVKCGHTRRNRVAKEDDFEIVIELSKKKIFTL